MSDNPGDVAALVSGLIDDNVALNRALNDEIGVIIQIASEITNAFVRGNKVFLFGNGGSAADAEHIAAELAGRFCMDRDPLPAIALSANTAAITAIANDFGYDEVFARQLRGLLSKGDVVIAISTSGASLNIIAAIQEARQRGAITVALTGSQGKLKQMAQHVLSVPSTDTPRIQEAHIVAGHIICHLVERNLFGTKPTSPTSDNT